EVAELPEEELRPWPACSSGTECASPASRARSAKGRMERRVVNPWRWQDRLGFVQANEVVGARRVLYCSGVVSVDDTGVPLYADDLQAQGLRALDNLETILHEAGYTLADVVRLNTYVV